MATTEIQKVPGNFNLPAGWPKITFPDLSGLLAEWSADSLSTGPIPATGWAPVAGDYPALTTRNNRAMPVIMTDAAGHKFARFEQSHIQTTINLSGDATFLAVVRPAAGESTAAQRIVSGTAQGFRALTRDGENYKVSQTTGRAFVTIGPVTVGGLTAIAGRYGADSLDGMQHGGAIATPASATAGVTQASLLVGSNGATSGTEGFFTGDLYRIQIWGRKLSDVDLGAALHANALKYGL